MTAIETAAAVLGKASLLDPRIGRPDKGAVVAWAELLGDLDREDALTVVTEHYRRSTERLMPGNVIDGVRRIRADRVRALPTDVLEPADVDPNDVLGYLAAKRELVAAAANGQAPRRHEIGKHRPVAALVQSAVDRLPRMSKAQEA